jgi:hypothetical protein
MSINIHGKEYKTVNERLQVFNEKYPNGAICSEMSFEGTNIVRCKSVIMPDVENPKRIFVGHAEERRDDGKINATSACENCETSAVGRALAMMGIGIEESVASADEVHAAISKQAMPKSAAHPNSDQPFVDEAAIDRVFGAETPTYAPIQDDGTQKPLTKTCPKCQVTHTGRYPKCLACWKADKAATK